MPQLFLALCSTLLCLALYTATSLTWAQTEQLAVPTFGTRGEVAPDLVESFMLQMRRTLVEETQLSVTVAELVTPGIAASLDLDLTLTIAALDNADYALSGEIRRSAQPDVDSAPYVVSILVAAVADERSSDLITAPLTEDDIASTVTTLAAAVADFIAPQRSLVAGEAGLFVSSQPADADITINGVNVGLASEAGVMMLEPGEYMVEVRKNGFLPAQRRVQLSRGLTETLNVPLNPLTGGSLQVVTRPRANVRLDGREVGETPLVAQALPGSHTVQVWRPGFETVSIDTLVRDYRVSSVEQTLTPNEGVSLYWDPVPEDLIFINGTLQLRSYMENLAPNLYEVEVRSRGEERSFLIEMPSEGTYYLNLVTQELEPHQ